LPAEFFLGLFESESFVVKQKAKIAYQELAKEPFCFKRAAKTFDLTDNPNNGSDRATQATTPSLSKSSRSINKKNLAPDLKSLQL
jgi:hypothetical protein